MSFTRQTFSSPTGSDTLETVTLGDSDDVNVLVLFEDAVDGDLLFEVGVGPVDLVGNVSTVQLDFNEMGAFLAEGSFADLGVGEDTDDRGNTLQLFKGSSDGGSSVSLILLSKLGEGLAFRAIPVLVEAAFDVVAQVFSHHSCNGTQTTWGLNISSNTTDNHGGGFNHGHSLQNFLLVHLGSRTVEIANYVSHASLEAHEGSQVHRLAGIVAGERFNLSVITASTFTWQESERTMTGSFKFTMRLQMNKWMDGLVKVGWEWSLLPFI